MTDTIITTENESGKELKTPISIERVVDLAETRDVRPIDQEHVECLALAALALPPVDVVKLTENRFGLLAGYHRREAARLAGRKTIYVRVHDLDPEQWHRFAVSSNLAHGLPLTNKQRQAAAKQMLLDDARRSDRDIAADCGLSAPTVGKLRREAIEDDESGVKDLHVRVGRDGKSYPVPSPSAPVEERAPEIEQEPQGDDEIKPTPSYKRSMVLFDMTCMLQYLPERNRCWTFAFDVDSALAHEDQQWIDHARSLLADMTTYVETLRRCIDDDEFRREAREMPPLSPEPAES